MKKLVPQIIACILITCTSAHADVRIEADHLVISGKLTNKDADDVVDAFNQQKLKQVIFRSSPGGEWSAGMRIGSYLFSKRITTIAEGMCASACALAFLGGEHRMMNTVDPASFLFFHTPYTPNDQQMVETLRFSIIAWIERRTGRTLPDKLKASIETTDNPRGGIFFFSDGHPLIKNTGATVFICSGKEERPPFDCEKTDAFDAISSGIVTAAP